MDTKIQMSFTADSLAKLIGCEYVVATNFLRLLAELELAKRTGTQKVPGKRGKGKSVFTIDAGFGAKLDELFNEARQVNPLATLDSDLLAASAV